MKRTRILPSLILLLASAPCGAWDVDIPSERVHAFSASPDAPAWAKVPPVTVRLTPQKLILPGGGGSIKEVQVQSLRTDDEIFIRLRWADATKNSKLDVSNGFVDAVAVQFPLDPSKLPSPFMGAKGAAVNIWRWSAAMQEPTHFPVAYADYHRPDAVEKTYHYPGGAEDLLAEGFGTLGPRPKQEVEAQGVWADGYWTVVFERHLTVSGGTPFKDGALVPVAFAVWDGAAKERDGMKSFSVWQNLLLGRPAPELPKDKIAQGAHAFSRYGCSQCHGEAGKGGVPNPDAELNPIPQLDTVSGDFSKDDVKYMIAHGRAATPKDPKGLRPRTNMNAWKDLMDKDELDAVVEYLFTLKGKPKKG